jgi:hypothetical protein
LSDVGGPNENVAEPFAGVAETEVGAVGVPMVTGIPADSWPGPTEFEANTLQV